MTILEWYFPYSIWKYMFLYLILLGTQMGQTFWGDGKPTGNDKEGVACLGLEHRTVQNTRVKRQVSTGEAASRGWRHEINTSYKVYYVFIAHHLVHGTQKQSTTRMSKKCRYFPTNLKNWYTPLLLWALDEAYMKWSKLVVGQLEARKSGSTGTKGEKYICPLHQILPNALTRPCIILCNLWINSRKMTTEGDRSNVLL